LERGQDVPPRAIVHSRKGYFRFFVRTEASGMTDLQLFSAYVDPVAVLPVTSIVATVVGVIVLCGKSTLQSVVRLSRRMTLRRHRGAGLRGAHFELRRRVRDERASESSYRNGAGTE
jgi:hypothetical protein